jgi:hypothetical protein
MRRHVGLVVPPIVRRVAAADMQLRDWLAGQAVSGMLADARAGDWTFSEVAEDAYNLADAMMAEREKERP